MPQPSMPQPSMPQPSMPEPLLRTDDVAAPGSGFSAATYGASFADVYDDWYPADVSTSDAVRAIVATAGDDGRVLELGIGTGRLAIPLVDAGLEVVGMDASSEMLAVLEHKAPSIPAVLGDVGRPEQWPQGHFDVVVAAFNLVCNLGGPEEQAAMFTAAAAALVPGGSLVVEAFVPAPMDAAERRLELRSVGAEGVTLIATDTDPAAGTVSGAHIELRDGEPVRLRPWRIVPAGAEQLDRWAAQAGLSLSSRSGDWSGAPLAPDAATHVSWYRLER